GSSELAAFRIRVMRSKFSGRHCPPRCYPIGLSPLCVAFAPHNFLSCASLPLNLSRLHRPIPLTVCGLGPRAPSVYCHIVQVFQFLGTTGVGPYCASQNQNSAKIGSGLVPRNSLM